MGVGGGGVVPSKLRRPKSWLSPLLAVNYLQFKLTKPPLFCLYVTSSTSMLKINQPQFTKKKILFPVSVCIFEGVFPLSLPIRAVFLSCPSQYFQVCSGYVSSFWPLFRTRLCPLNDSCGGCCLSPRESHLFQPWLSAVS